MAAIDPMAAGPSIADVLALLDVDASDDVSADAAEAAGPSGSAGAVVDGVSVGECRGECVVVADREVDVADGDHVVRVGVAAKVSRVSGNVVAVGVVGTVVAAGVGDHLGVAMPGACVDDNQPPADVAIAAFAALVVAAFTGPVVAGGPVAAFAPIAAPFAAVNPARSAAATTPPAPTATSGRRATASSSTRRSGQGTSAGTCAGTSADTSAGTSADTSAGTSFGAMADVGPIAADSPTPPAVAPADDDTAPDPDPVDST